MLEDIKENYERAKKLAREIWFDGDNEGNSNDYYYFQCGFIAGFCYADSIKYNLLKKEKDEKIN